MCLSFKKVEANRHTNQLAELFSNFLQFRGFLAERAHRLRVQQDLKQLPVHIADRIHCKSSEELLRVTLSLTKLEHVFKQLIEVAILANVSNKCTYLPDQLGQMHKENLLGCRLCQQN